MTHLTLMRLVFSKGYLVIPGVMDPEWIAAALSTVNNHRRDMQARHDCCGYNGLCARCVRRRLQVTLYVL